ncbi:unnamed protein product [Effrenium voratum]|nr:unnamed protein product [Effrenium voratum]
MLAASPPAPPSFPLPPGPPCPPAPVPLVASAQDPYRAALQRKVADDIIQRLSATLRRGGYRPEDLFSKLDADGSGHLSRQELLSIILRLEPGLSPAEQDAVFQCFDADGSGGVSWSEFWQTIQGGATMASQPLAQTLPPTASAMPLAPLSGMPLSATAVPAHAAVQTGFDKTIHPQELQRQRMLAEEILGRIAATISRTGRRPQDFLRDVRGTLFRAEVEQTLFRFEPNLTAYERDAVMQRLGADGHGNVDATELCRILGGDLSRTLDPRALPAEIPVGMAPQELLRQVAAELRRSGVEAATLFRSLDVSGSGHLSAQDLSVMAQTFWPELTQDELRDLFQTVCRNRSGYIEMSEFCAALGFDERTAVSSAESLRSLCQLEAALQVLVDRVRNSVLEAGIEVFDLFQKLDTSGTGYLRYEEISLMAYTFDSELTSQQLDALFRYFDPRGCGIVDFEGFKRRLGFMSRNHEQKMAMDQAVKQRIAEAAQTLYARGCSVQDAFAIFDANRNGFLDQTEFYRLLVACDCKVGLEESDQIFAEVSRNAGRVDINAFAQAFAISPGPATRAIPRQPQVDQRRRFQAAQVCSWLEPALVSQNLALAGRDRLSRPEFDRVALALEPRLGSPDLDRLWRLAGNAPELSLQQLLQCQHQVSNTDPWAEACLRRIARRLAPALSSPANFFQRFNLTGSGLLSYAEFERMVLAQDGSMSREDVGALWRLADADGNGRLDLNEFVGLLRQAQLEGMTAAARQPANISEQDMILEARVAQMERSFRNRGVTLLQACQMMDVARTGFLDRSGLRRLMSAAGLDLATWEQEELTRRCDPGRNGLLNYYELARQFDFEAQAKALAAQAPGAVLAPGAVSDPLKEYVDVIRARLQQSGYSLAQGFGLFDQTGGGTLDRSGFMRFLDWAQVSMAATEQDALFQRFPSPPGLLNYRAIINQFDTWHDSISTQTCCPQPASPKHIYQPSGSSRPTTNSVGACHKPKLGCATATCYSKDSQPAHITSMSCAGALPSGNANRKPGTTISDCCAICTGSPRHAKPTWQLHVFCAYSAGSTNSTGSRPTWAVVSSHQPRPCPANLVLQRCSGPQLLLCQAVLALRLRLRQQPPTPLMPGRPGPAAPLAPAAPGTPSRPGGFMSSAPAALAAPAPPVPGRPGPPAPLAPAAPCAPSQPGSLMSAAASPMPGRPGPPAPAAPGAASRPGISSTSRPGLSSSITRPGFAPPAPGPPPAPVRPGTSPAVPSAPPQPGAPPSPGGALLSARPGFGSRPTLSAVGCHTSSSSGPAAPPAAPPPAAHVMSSSSSRAVRFG